MGISLLYTEVISLLKDPSKVKLKNQPLCCIPSCLETWDTLAFLWVFYTFCFLFQTPWLTPCHYHLLLVCFHFSTTWLIMKLVSAGRWYIKASVTCGIAILKPCPSMFPGDPSWTKDFHVHAHFSAWCCLQVLTCNCIIAFILFMWNCGKEFGILNYMYMWVAVETREECLSDT